MPSIVPTAWPKPLMAPKWADLTVRTPAPLSPMPPMAAETVIQTETPRTVAWPDTRPLSEDQPTDHYLRSEVFGPAADGALLADIVAVIPHPIVALNASGQIVFWSDAATETFGWTSEEVVGRPPSFLPPDRFTEHTRQFVRATAGVRVREFATDRYHRDGRRIPVLVSMAVDAGGGVVCVYQLMPQDIPVAVPIDEPKADVRSEQSRKLETLGRVAAGVVHDLNNLLAVIGGNADLLVGCLSPTDPGHAYAGVIRACAQHAAALTTRALSFAKPTQSPPVAVNLSSVVTDLDPFLRAIAGPRIACVISPGDRLPPVWADRGHLEQVIVNLVTNARDALRSGGVVGLRTSAVTVDPGRAGWPTDRPSGRYLCLTVADNGRGTDDPMRAVKPNANVWQGLATVREIVERYRGHIEADSEPDLGTVFRIYFPAMPSKDDRTANRTIPHAGESALLVDDDESVRAIARVVLESVGYGVIEAATGDEAVRLARAVRNIDLLVTDMVLPGLSGRKVMDRLRATRPDLPVVLISGYPQPQYEPESATHFVKKPFLPPDLLAAVRKVTREVAVS
ncbi:hybrid sensor histidine kinase/response regulator [Limnoglobus roseus]|uniref:histidine kinase n=1 Tax=Limnoglobus roseus TaxID=2598579 RepID=A0A5C1ABW6_9BACT|nr:response regulator [Limnoglobus roseus]QEL15526.1 putative histidine kinase [Limnoglobus roseus]